MVIRGAPAIGVAAAFGVALGSLGLASKNFNDFYKRIENIIDKLQISILEKVGSYGKNLENTKKEMSMMQDSFRKVMNSPREKDTKSK